MPGRTVPGLDRDRAWILLDGIYSSVVIREVLGCEGRRRGRQITDPALLREIILYLAGHIGSSVSLHAVSSALAPEKRLEGRVKPGKPANQTLASYVAPFWIPACFMRSSGMT